MHNVHEHMVFRGNLQCEIPEKKQNEFLSYSFEFYCPSIYLGLTDEATELVIIALWREGP